MDSKGEPDILETIRQGRPTQSLAEAQRIIGQCEAVIIQLRVELELRKKGAGDA